MARGDDIEERLIDFAVRVIRVCEALLERPAYRHIRGQLLRSAPPPRPITAKHAVRKAERILYIN